jgi:hypothetical protein
VLRTHGSQSPSRAAVPGGRKINLRHAFAGQAVGIKEVLEKIWLVTFVHYDVGSSITKGGA